MRLFKAIFLASLLCCLCGTMTAQDKWEAENAQRNHCNVVYDGIYSGGMAVRMTEENARLSFSINLDEGGKYTVYVAGDGIGGEKVVNCKVNETSTSFRLNQYNEVEVGLFFMQKGTNTLTITPSNGQYNPNNSPKTGDQNDIGLWIAILVASLLAVAAVAAYLILKKRGGKKKDAAKQPPRDRR